MEQKQRNKSKTEKEIRKQNKLLKFPNIQRQAKNQGKLKQQRKIKASAPQDRGKRLNAPMQEHAKAQTPPEMHPHKCKMSAPSTISPRVLPFGPPNSPLETINNFSLPLRKPLGGISPPC